MLSIKLCDNVVIFIEAGGIPSPRPRVNIDKLLLHAEALKDFSHCHDGAIVVLVHDSCTRVSSSSRLLVRDMVLQSVLNKNFLFI